jgi:oxygen-dependent protoporphyrinogen oxidase
LRLEADNIVLAIPPQQAASLLRAHDDGLLNDIPSTSVAVVNLGYRKSVLDRSGYGYLVPSCEKEPVLGMVWDSSVFPQQSNHAEETRLTVMIGTARLHNFAACREEDFVDIALGAIHRHLGIRTPPCAIVVKIARQAIPQYTIGHAARVKEIEQRLAALSPRIRLLGNGLHGVSVNECIAQISPLWEDLRPCPQKDDFDAIQQRIKADHSQQQSGN